MLIDVKDLAKKAMKQGHDLSDLLNKLARLRDQIRDELNARLSEIEQELTERQRDGGAALLEEIREVKREVKVLESGVIASTLRHDENIERWTETMEAIISQIDLTTKEHKEREEREERERRKQDDAESNARVAMKKWAESLQNTRALLKEIKDLETKLEK